jgi:outer membrane protein insertion porin family
VVTLLEESAIWSVSAKMPPPAPPLRPAVWLLLLAASTAILAAPASGSWWNPWKKEAPAAAPKLLGENIRIRFVGNTLFSERKLRDAISEQLTQIRAEGLSRPNADDAAYYTAVFYHQNGYASADVVWEIRRDELLLTLNEGKLVTLRSSGISGNKGIPSATLLSLLSSVTAERLKLGEAHLPFVLDDLQTGTNRIVDFYQNEGFLDATVSGPEVSFSPDGTAADVLISIEEGRRYRFGPLRLKGPLAHPEEELRAALSKLLALPYTPARQVAVQSTLLQFYAERGHFEATVNVEGEPAAAAPDGAIPLSVTVQHGPVFTFGELDARGLARTRLDWLQRRFESLLGRTYHPDKLALKQSELMASGIFDSLRLTPLPQSDHTLRLDVEATEAKARELGFSLGYGNYEGAMAGIRLADRNLFGRALPAGLELAFSQRAIALEATLADPWLFETRTEFVSRAFIRSRMELGYSKREAGVRGELSRRLLPPFQLAAFGQIRSTEVTSADIPIELLGNTGYQTATLGLSAIWDKRDSALNPTTGWIGTLLGDTNTLSTGETFTRTSGRLTWHHPLPGRVRFAASARFGLLQQRSAVPIDERYFLGGPGTVRSFKQRELGIAPNQPYPAGGSAYSLVNAEADFPLWSRLRGALFFDAGSLSPTGGSVPTEGFRTAVGMGVRYALPVGPVRLDVGFNPNRTASESWGAAHLSFGFAF